ncbi:heavy metal-binding domain-containing protein [Streptomyces sp. NBC_01006]|uniref:heavy metal-binding domain-containing protein n=1 Tax=Streptomyces sp. NBC_01006 TaxID=2903716 RepID=UPI002F91743E|nr:heavy metal-binding domain-containing protein [Streptomyces sp. NBC_01006]
MYTTDTVPGSGPKPVKSSWLLLHEGDRLHKVMSELRQQASKDGADAVVGLRITAAELSGPSPFIVYGTALKFL